MENGWPAPVILQQTNSFWTNRKVLLSHIISFQAVLLNQIFGYFEAKLAETIVIYLKAGGTD
jgi:hypothetical protein